MQKSDEIKKELEEISPGMAQLSRKDPFSAPDEYFRLLHTEVQHQIRDTSRTEKLSKRHVFGPATHRWIAASIAILILGSAYYYKAWKSFNPGNYTNTESYIIENFDEATITEYLTEISAKSDDKNELMENSLENIDEEIIIEEL